LRILRFALRFSGTFSLALAWFRASFQAHCHAAFHTHACTSNLAAPCLARCRILRTGHFYARRRFSNGASAPAPRIRRGWIVRINIGDVCVKTSIAPRCAGCSPPPRRALCATRAVYIKWRFAADSVGNGENMA